MNEWSGRLLVLGLGASGLAVAEWGLSRAAGGADVTVFVVDSGSGPVLEERAELLRRRGASVSLGVTGVSDADLVVPSPGIMPTSELYRAAERLGRPMVSEIELAYRLSVAPWIAITGTNGKTTTTALVTHLLREAGFAAEPAGNFGPPAISVATRAGEAGVIVAEVSSFQLLLVDRFHPRVGVLLNVTPDHLDYHRTMDAYAAAKAGVFARQTVGDTAVIDVDDSGSAQFVGSVAATGVDVRSISRIRRDAQAFVSDRMLRLRVDGTVVDLVPVEDLGIKGHHNVSNALAAAAAAHAFGADVDSLRRGLTSFRAIAHRLEPVGTIDGVEYYNDSKATNPDAVLKALTAFEGRPVVLLLGGRNKGIDMGPLARVVGRTVKAVILFGEASKELDELFADAPIPHTVAGDLESAIGAARACAAPGDVVLLSPACTSWDEFSDYAERGDRFKALVRSMEGDD